MLSRRSFVGRGSVAAAMALAASCLMSPWSLVGCSFGKSDHEAQMRSLQDQLKSPDAATSSAELLSLSTMAFDTLVVIAAYTDESTIRELLLSCNAYDQMFSSQREGSEIYTLNHAQGERVQVSPQTYSLIKQAVQFAHDSNGAFDLTVGSVSLLWDFVKGVKPTDAAIQEGLLHIGYQHVILEDDNYVRLDDPQTMIDLGGIAKGWIADDFARRLREAGVSGAIINLGGNVYVVGSKQVDGQRHPWRVAIKDPNNPDESIVGTLDVTDKSVVTSGIYERHFVLDGKDYWHIIDPQTGYPKDSDLSSVTVVSDSSAVGDALSTTLFLEGVEQGTQALARYQGVDAFFVKQDGQELTTSGLAQYNFTRVHEEMNTGTESTGDATGR